MPPAANCAADTSRALGVEALGTCAGRSLRQWAMNPWGLGPGSLTTFIGRTLRVVRKRWEACNLIAIDEGSTWGPQGAILPTTATNPLEVPTPNPGYLSSH